MCSDQRQDRARRFGQRRLCEIQDQLRLRPLTGLLWVIFVSARAAMSAL